MIIYVLLYYIIIYHLHTHTHTQTIQGRSWWKQPKNVWNPNCLDCGSVHFYSSNPWSRKRLCMILPCILQAISIHISIHKTTLWLWPVRAIPLPWSSCKTSAKQHLGVVVEGKIRTLQKRPFKPVPVRFAQDLQDFKSWTNLELTWE